jgi:hypothetical protein
MSVATLVLLVLGQAQPPPPGVPQLKMTLTPYRVPAYPNESLIMWEQVQIDLALSKESRSAIQLARQTNQYGSIEGYQRYDMRKSPPSISLGKNPSGLTAAQNKRLGQVYLQYYDVDAMSDPTVAAMIPISSTTQKWISNRLSTAWNNYQLAQQKMFQSFQKDNEAMRVKYFQAHPSESKSGSFSYTVPRAIQNRQTDLTRRTSLFGLVQFAEARRDIRAHLTAEQLAKFESLKGRPMASWFYAHAPSFGSAQTHPELLSNINVQAALGMSLKEYLDFMQARRDRRPESEYLDKFVARLPTDKKARFLQLGLQYDREFSILRHDVAKELGLSQTKIDSMLVQLETLFVEGYAKADKFWLNLDHGGSDQVAYADRGKVLSDYDAKERQSILNALTPAQREKWRVMLGKEVPEIQPTRVFG